MQRINKSKRDGRKEERKGKIGRGRKKEKERNEMR